MGFFIRFAEVLVRCLCFHFFTYVVHAVSENHFKLGTWAVTKNGNFQLTTYGSHHTKPICLVLIYMTYAMLIWIA